MVNKYDNIDFCLNLLFDYIYGKPTECYELQYKSKKNLPINDLKKNQHFDQTNILKTNITYKGKNHDKLIFKRHSKTSYPSLIRIGLYSKSNININDFSRGELIDMKINYLLSELAINDIFKFILFPVFNFDTNIKKIKQLNESMSNVLEKEIKKERHEDTLYLQIFEHYYKLKTLNEYLKLNYKNFTTKHWQILSFQILYALYKIQKNYESFRHNKLDLDSVYIYVLKETDKSNIIKIKDKIYVIPNIGFEIKITFFYFSDIKGYADNNDAPSKNENQYYDVHYFYSHLLNFLKKK